jgi:hypothetical protein
MENNKNKSTFKPTLETDSLAIQEDQFFNFGRDLETEAAESEHDRFQKFRESFNCIAIWMLYVFALLFVAGMFSIAWHLMMPESCHYLSLSQQDKLHTIVSSALFSSIATNYIKNRVQ